MKENNKFSLSAFFCSLVSKSKLSKLVLLGAPFFLVQFFTLKVCASSVAVPGSDGLLVTPAGGVNSPIHNVLKMDTGSINSSLWVALGLDPLDLYDILEDANEAYQDGNQVVYDAIIDALNEQDAGSGDLLNYVIESTFQATSQSGYFGKLSIPDDVWNRVNKATKNGLTLRISNGTNPSAQGLLDFMSQYGNVNDVSSYINQNFSNFFVSPAILGKMDSTLGDYLYILSFDTVSYSISNRQLSLQVGSSDRYNSDTTAFISDGSRWWTANYLSVNSSGWFVVQSRFAGAYNVITSYSSSVNKSLGVAQPFISNKANENYDIVSKSSTYNPDTGKIEGARSVNLITPEYLSQLVSSLRDGILSIPEALQRLGIGAIDTDQAIPIGIGFDIDTLSHVVAQSVPQEATASATREAFLQLDNFTFYTPDDFIGVPSVSPLPVAMNWLAVQMQTMMSLTSFQNCWVVLSTLAVLSLLVGLIRISK